MKICPKCQEENSDVMDKCYKCGTPLASGPSKKICNRCGKVSHTSGNTCVDCGGYLSTYSPSTGASSSSSSYYHYSSEDVETWEKVLAILIPLIGLILGFIHIGKDDKEGGKKLIVISLVTCVICWIASYIFPSFFLFKLLS